MEIKVPANRKISKIPECKGIDSNGNPYRFYMQKMTIKDLINLCWGNRLYFKKTENLNKTKLQKWVDYQGEAIWNPFRLYYVPNGFMRDGKRYYYLLKDGHHRLLIFINVGVIEIWAWIREYHTEYDFSHDSKEEKNYHSYMNRIRNINYKMKIGKRDPYGKRPHPKNLEGEKN